MSWFFDENEKAIEPIRSKRRRKLYHLQQLVFKRWINKNSYTWKYSYYNHYRQGYCYMDMDQFLAENFEYSKKTANGSKYYRYRRGRRNPWSSKKDKLTLQEKKQWWSDYFTFREDEYD
jgi:hypothetical protein